VPREAVPTDETQEATGTTSATCKPGSVAPRSSGVPDDYAGSAASSGRMLRRRRSEVQRPAWTARATRCVVVP